MCLEDVDTREVFTTMMPSYTSLSRSLYRWRNDEKPRDDSNVINKVEAVKGYISYEGEIIINRVLFFIRYLLYAVLMKQGCLT